MTEDHVLSLQELFEIADEDRYAHWCQVYASVNRVYLKNPDTRTTADNARRQLRKTLPSEVLPEVFFCLAFAFLLERRRAPALEEQHQGLWWELNQRAQTNAKTLSTLLEDLQPVIALANQGDRQGCSRLMLPEVADWLHARKFDALLDELLSVIEADRTTSQRILDSLHDRDRSYNPGQKTDVHTDWTYRAVDRVARIFSDHSGRRNRDIKGALLLFRNWDFNNIDRRSLKGARKRRTKKGTT